MIPMTRYSHLEPSSPGPTLPEAIAVIMLFSLLFVVMLGCALGELSLRLFPSRHES